MALRPVRHVRNYSVRKNLSNRFWKG